MQSNSISKAAVLVTGASSGIGQACALELSKRGFQVFATVRKPADAEALTQTGIHELIPIMLDVTNQQSIDSAVKQISQSVGTKGLSGLVNNAGIGASGPLEFLPVEDLRQVYEVNVFGLLAVTQAFLPLLREGTGRIVNIGSVVGKITIPFGSPISSSKYAVESLNDALRMELKPWGIKVILVQPFAIATPVVDKVASKSRQLLQQMSPDAKALYGKDFEGILTMMVEQEKRAEPPRVIADAVFKALTKRSPKTRYPVGGPGNLLLILSKWLPDKALDWIKLSALKAGAK